jgi:DNA modification methylase
MQIRDRIKELRRVKASELRPSPHNWRKHPDSQQNALRGVLAEIGYADALIARTLPGDELELVDGHLRADMTPDTEVPVLVTDLSEDEAKKMLVTLDPLAAMADADTDMLESLLKEVDTKNDALQQMLEDLAADNDITIETEESEVEDAPEPQTDRAEELREQWGVERGQLWVIEGKQTHRLLCGDATDLRDVQRLMGSERAGLMNTDPPYGVAYANNERPNPGVAKPRVAKPRVANDILQDDDLQVFLEAAFGVASEGALKINAAWYLWHAHLTQGFFAAAAAATAQVVLHRQIIWVKPVLLLGRGQYHQKHEPCFMGWVKGNRPPDYGKGNGERTQTTVWQIESVSHKERREYNHSTPKPCELFRVPIVKHLRQNELCYDPFAGSGPQLVAAEQLGRVCHAIDIEPKYVAVCIQRMADMGCEPRLDSND